MAKDKRYSAVRSMIEVGNISSFKEIFEIIPRTLVSKDMGMNYQTFTRKVADPDQFSIKEMIYMATQLFEVPPEELFKKIVADLPPVKKKAK